MGCITALLESGEKKLHRSLVEGGGVYKGYEYLIILNTMGYRCGYVAIPESHPLHKLDSYQSDGISNLEMHGGCTFYERQFTKSDCNDKWIGFDCAHSGDAMDLAALRSFAPESTKAYEDMGSRYGDFCDYETIKSKDYVEKNCKSIIDQLTH